MPQRLVSNRNLIIYVALEPKIAFISKATKRLKGRILGFFIGIGIPNVAQILIN